MDRPRKEHITGVNLIHSVNFVTDSYLGLLNLLVRICCSSNYRKYRFGILIIRNEENYVYSVFSVVLLSKRFTKNHMCPNAE